MCLCVDTWIHSAREWNEAKETGIEAKWECKTAESGRVGPGHFF